jgi:hypothetical protein
MDVLSLGMCCEIVFTHTLYDVLAVVLYLLLLFMLEMCYQKCSKLNAGCLIP